MRLEKKFITAIAATAAAVFSLGSAQAVEPIKTVSYTHLTLPTKA